MAGESSLSTLNSRLGLTYSVEKLDFNDAQIFFKLEIIGELTECF